MTKHKYPNNLTYDDNDLITLEYFGDGSAGLDTEKIQQAFSRFVTTHTEESNVEGDDQIIYGSKSFKSSIETCDSVLITDSKPYLSSSNLTKYVKWDGSEFQLTSDVRLWRDLTYFQDNVSSKYSEIPQSSGLTSFFKKEELASWDYNSRGSSIALLNDDSTKVLKASEFDYNCGVVDPNGMGLVMSKKTSFSQTAYNARVEQETKLTGSRIVLSSETVNLNQNDVLKALSYITRYYGGTSLYTLRDVKPLNRATITFSELSEVLEVFGKKFNETTSAIEDISGTEPLSSISKESYKTTSSAYSILHKENVSEIVNDEGVDPEEGDNSENIKVDPVDLTVEVAGKCLYAFTREILGTNLSKNTTTLTFENEALVSSTNKVSLGDTSVKFRDINTHAVNGVISYEVGYYAYVYHYAESLKYKSMESLNPKIQGLEIHYTVSSKGEVTYDVSIDLVKLRDFLLDGVVTSKSYYLLRIEYDLIPLLALSIDNGYINPDTGHKNGLSMSEGVHKTITVPLWMIGWLFEDDGVYNNTYFNKHTFKNGNAPQHITGRFKFVCIPVYGEGYREFTFVPE